MQTSLDLFILFNLANAKNIKKKQKTVYEKRGK